MARAVRAWEYLYGGLSFAGAGFMIILGVTFEQSTQALTSGIAVLLVEVGFGALLIGIGAYWIWRFDIVRRNEAGMLRSQSPPS